MTKRMLIDATHAEETRVVVLDGNRLEDFDVETSTKRQLKGNIYLAKVVRVEPSLQACFVEYGGNRHGFLAFSEIHPDYYQIPVADRQRLIDMEAEEARREEEEADRALEGDPRPATFPAPAEAETFDESGAALETLAESAPQPEPFEPAPFAAAPPVESEPPPSAPSGDSISGAAAPPLLDVNDSDSGHVPGAMAAAPVASEAPRAEASDSAPAPETGIGQAADSIGSAAVQAPTPQASTTDTPITEALPTELAAEPNAATPDHDHDPDPGPDRPARRAQPLIIETETITADTEAPDEDFAADADADSEHDFAPDRDFIPEPLPPETVGGEPDSAEEQRERRIPPRFLRNYKIQEVIRRRQILLVQVVKEERGTKGAALTTYLSLAGRFSVLMPNSPRGGGISRKITSATDRRRLKDVIAELDMPKGMGLIVRTAGANRPKPEIKRDCEYLLRLWDDIREHTMKSVAPALIYEEASLIKRAIRDVYSRDIDEIQVDGEDGWRAAHEFMRMLMPSHAKKVQLWRDQSQPLFARHQVETQLDAMLQPTVQLRSGGYLVINQAEALVAIDVNSGRATRERNVEEMALRTNLEAADEVARQLRLRDLAGLIVIDFIDMEAKRHNAMVERRIKEALKNDRARIQVGHISHFGLLEMSRQRLRPSLAETSFILCPHCGGTGHVRSTESAAIHVLRGIEDEGSKHRSAEIVVHVATPTALYILNHKRERLREIELRYAMRVTVLGDDTQVASQYRIDRVRAQTAPAPAVITPDSPQPGWTPPEPESGDQEPDHQPQAAEASAEATATAEDDEAGAGETSAESGDRGDQADRHRRRRRRRRGRRDESGQPESQAAALVAGLPPEGETPFSTAGDEQPEPGETRRAATAEPPELPARGEPQAESTEGVPELAEPPGEDDSRRRRGRRGGRRRRRDGEGEGSPFAAPGAEQPDLPPVYIGPTPANPFGGQAFDIFDVLEQAEASAAAARRGPPEPVVQRFEPAPAQSPAPPPAPAPQDAASPPTDPQAAVPLEASAPPEIVNTAAPEPLPAESAEPPALATDIQPEPPATPEVAPGGAPEVANNAVPEPAIRPILIGGGEETPTEKKRGWWRR